MQKGDAVPLLSAADATAVEGEDITFEVTLSEPNGVEIRFNCVFSFEADDTAILGDVGSVGQAGRIAAGDTSTTCTTSVFKETAPRIYEGEETFTLTLEVLENAAAGRTVAKGYITEFHDVPIVGFQGQGGFVAEQNTTYDTMCLEIDILSSLTSEVTLNYSGTGTENADYRPRHHQVGIATNQKQFCVPIDLPDDNIYEDDTETIIVYLSSSDPHMNVDPTADTFTLSITDHDRAPNLTIEGGTGHEGGSNMGHTPVPGQEFGNVPFTFTLAGTAERGIDFHYELQPITATPDLDYSNISGTVIIPAGQTVGHLLVPIIDDSEFESDQPERFRFFIIGSGQRVHANGKHATGYIRDNDPAPTISIADATALEGENLEFQLTLSPASGFVTNVAYSITGVSATEQRDYRVPRSQSLSIPSGATSARISIETRDDLYIEEDETLTVTLTGVENATAVRGSATGTIEDEDEGKPPVVDTIRANRWTRTTISPGDSWENRTAKVGIIEHYYDQDWFKTTLEGGTCYQLEIRGEDDQRFYDGIGPGHSAWGYRPTEKLTLTDPFLQGVYDRRGNYFEDTQNDDGGDGLGAKLNVRLANTAPVFKSVSHSWFDIGGRYDLSIIDIGTATRHCVDIDN